MYAGLMKQRKKQRELVDLLADYADVLNHGDDDAARWLDSHASLKTASSFLILFQLAQAVKRVLVPVEPSPVFRSNLKMQLAQSELKVEVKRPFPKTIWLGAAVSIMGLAIYLLRRFRPAVVGW